MTYPYYVYILANYRHTMLYVGVTNNLRARVWEHKTKRNHRSHTAKYNVHKLVYYEGFQWINQAIKREKFIKGKLRRWKEELICSLNPEWTELKPPG